MQGYSKRNRVRLLFIAAFGLFAAPYFFGRTIEAANLTVSWASSVESDVAGYRLRYGTTPGHPTVTLDAGLTNSRTATNLFADQTYYFSVTAYDVAGNESLPSAEAMARVPGSAVIPRIDALVDDSIDSVYVIRSQTRAMRIEGRNLMPGCTIDLGPDIVAGRPFTNAAGELISLIKAQDSSPIGPRTVTVTNPDGGIASATDLVQVVRNPDSSGDCVVDLVDLNALARAWNEAIGETRYVQNVDLDNDGYVGPNDLSIFVKFYELTFSGCS